jgi:hypothetical protein
MFATALPRRNRLKIDYGAVGLGVIAILPAFFTFTKCSGAQILHGAFVMERTIPAG